MGDRTECRTRGNLNLVVNQNTFIYLFTSFSGHIFAQRECAWTGLRSHARCHPYRIPQPVKFGHTTGVCDPYSFRIVMRVLLRPTRTNQWKCYETGPTLFRPYPRRLDSLTVITKAALSSHLFKDPECWCGRSLNSRPPTRQTGALPTELTRLRSYQQLWCLENEALVKNRGQPFKCSTLPDLL